MSAPPPKQDLFAEYLAQVDAYLNDRRAYDLLLRWTIIPFLKHIGPGIVGLAKYLEKQLGRGNSCAQTPEHPDGGIS